MSPLSPADLNWSLRRGADAQTVAVVIRGATAEIRDFLGLFKANHPAGLGSRWSDIADFSWRIQRTVVKVLHEGFLDDEVVNWFVQEESHITDVQHYIQYLENKAARLALIDHHLSSPSTRGVAFAAADLQISTGTKKSARTIFYSYSSADESLRLELERHLAVLKRTGLIETWAFRQIEAGDDWHRRIDERLNSASVILLLVSANFLASDYCWDVEMKRAIERHETGDSVVVPIILRDCDWHAAPFSKLQALPQAGKPVTRWRPRDRAWSAIAGGIRRLIESLEHKS